MRRLMLVLIVMLAVACDANAVQLVTVNAAASSVESASPPPESPPPPVCSEYDALEHGAGDVRNQDWFNHLPARDGDKGYARVRLDCVYRMGADQFAALDELWQLEADGADDRNGTDWHATNVPQAKPFSKMNCSTIDHRCQVRWGLSYIVARYGTPARALAAWRARSPHWY